MSQRNSLVTKLKVRRRLRTIKCLDYNKLNEYFEDFEGLIDKIERLGEKIDETDKICYLLIGLGISVESLEGMTSSIHFEYVKSYLLELDMSEPYVNSRQEMWAELVFNLEGEEQKLGKQEQNSEDQEKNLGEQGKSLEGQKQNVGEQGKYLGERGKNSTEPSQNLGEPRQNRGEQGKILEGQKQNVGEQGKNLTGPQNLGEQWQYLGEQEQNFGGKRDTFGGQKNRKSQDIRRRDHSYWSREVVDPTYRPMVIPTRRPEEFLKVVPVKGRMLKKHEQSAPFHIFYTTISSAPQTHHQPLSITFQEILDLSLGELCSSLQITYMVEPGWLLAQYYFAGYSAKRLTILYGDKNNEMDALRGKKPNVDAYYVQMVDDYGLHHTKLMILDYEDGSLRVVISTANLYYEDWENTTQGLWMSPNCPPLPEGSSPIAGESPTKFKSYLIKYLMVYCRSEINYYIGRVEACDFTHINVFLIGSVPGIHYNSSWGMKRVGMLLGEHCTIPAEENHEWQVIGQSSSVGDFGKDPTLWLTGAFQQNFCATKNNSSTPQMRDPEFNFIYPSLDNVKQSYNYLLGGGCPPYSENVHSKQGWITKYMCEWSARISHRHRAIPHLKSYLRYHSDGKAAYYILTSGNLSKSAWGTPLKNQSAIRIFNYELGVLLLPKFVTGKDYFTTKKDENDALYLPYDIPLVKYASNTRPWLAEYITRQ